MNPIILLLRLIYWMIGWKARPNYPKEIKKSVCIIAPHTSNWDFMVLVIARYLIGMGKAHFLAKKALFEHPIGGKLFYWLGGTPVDRSQKTSLVEQAIEKFETNDEFVIAITPEGTRSYVKDWKSGFYHIAVGAQVPITFGFCDFYKREVGVDGVYYPTGDYETDLEEFKTFYRTKYPFEPKNSNLEYTHKSVRKRQWKNRIFTGVRLALVWAAISLLWNFDYVIYGIQQGYGQVNIMLNTQPIEAYLEDDSFPDSLKSKIHYINEIKEFTVNNLGFTPSDNYTSLYNQKGEPILWVLTASEPYRLKAKTWDYPILGKMSYKGFFEKERAIEHRDALAKEGWDTRLGVVNAWSTLGVLNDPILSNFLYRNEGSLANLIIHELTHGTIFIKNNISYNENLADFIGDEGAQEFLKKKYGEASDEYLSYINRKKDRNLFSNYVLKAATQLDSLYATFDDTVTEEVKKKRKEEAIANLTQFPDSLQFYSERYPSYFNNYTPNNAFFMAYRRYREKQNQFKKQCDEQFDGDLKSFIAYMKEENPSIF